MAVIFARTYTELSVLLNNTISGVSLFRNQLTKTQMTFLKTVFAIAVGMTALKEASNLLSKAVLNNFTRTSFNWRKEIVVVTGGSGGLGDLLVRKLAKRCIKVISLDVVPPKVPLPQNTHFYHTDITSSDSISTVAKQIREEHGNPTVLVNNAGVGNMSPLLNESEDWIRKTFEVNIIAHFLLIKEFLPAMIQENHGHVITIASMASFITGVGNIDYACTKAAALAFHEGLAQELRHAYKAPGVRTSVIHPTYIRTPMVEPAFDEAGGFKSEILEADPVVDRIVAQILSGNSGQIFLPKHLAMASGVRGWPSWLQEVARNTQKSVLIQG